MMESNTYLVFDTETVGLDPAEKGCQILTISAGVLDISSGEVSVEFNQYCTLTTEVEAKICVENYLGADSGVKYATVQDSLERSGWSKTTERHGSEKEVLESFYCYVTSYSNPVLLAYNASFDMRWVNNRLKHYGMQPINLHVIDVLDTARLELEPVLEERNDLADMDARHMLRCVTFQTEKRTWRSYSLENVARMFNVYSNRAHESKADIIMTGNVYVSIKKYINGVCPDAKYVAASLKSVRSLKCYFRSEASWNRIYYRKRARLLSLCTKNALLAARSYRDFLISELRRENRRRRNNEKRSRMIMDNLLVLNEMIEMRRDKKAIAKLIYFGML